MSLLRSISITLVFRILSLLLGLIGGVLLARCLGAAGRGILAVLETVGLFVLMFAGQWVYNSNVYLVSSDPTRLPKLYRNSLTYSLVGGVLLSLALGAGFRFGHGFGLRNVSFDLLLPLLLGIPAQLFSSAAEGLLLGCGRIVAYNSVQLAQTATYLLALAALILGTGGILLFHLLVVVLVLRYLTAIATLVYLDRALGLSPGLRFDADLLREGFRFGAKLVLATLASFLIMRANVLILNYLREAWEVGVYAITNRLADMVFLVPSLTVSLLLPHLTAEPDRARRHALVVKYTRALIVFVAALCLGLAATGWFLIPWLFGPDFRDAYLPLLLLFPGMIALTFSMTIVQNLTAIGLPKEVPLVWWIATAVNLPLDALLIHRWGILGLAAGTSFTYLGLAWGILLVYRRHIGGSFRDLVRFDPREYREIVTRMTEKLVPRTSP